ncbi:DUF6262 family protein [Candidatus Mycolicibacterium alkanivorans]|uniref:DUF6262 family protein n=1 Tax=Candidatus Mycolicibacterium alkanivorans TaxID=2954114 RepID=A0ABS9YSD7_9MYCO|nr:DUF6262 family protein [Candidatus Mycolicibacterium alkanivorans]
MDTRRQTAPSPLHRPPHRQGPHRRGAGDALIPLAPARDHLPAQAGPACYLIEHAKHRRQETVQRAHQALAELAETGQSVTVAELATRAGVSRSWTYTQPELLDQIQQQQRSRRRTRLLDHRSGAHLLRPRRTQTSRRGQFIRHARPGVTHLATSARAALCALGPRPPRHRHRQHER